MELSFTVDGRDDRELYLASVAERIWNLANGAPHEGAEVRVRVGADLLVYRHAGGRWTLAGSSGAVKPEWREMT